MNPPKRRTTAPVQAEEPKSGQKLPRPTGSDNAARLARALHFRFRDLSLLRTALTHRSILHELAGAGISTTHPAALTNERLEFLGDAVLGAVAAEYLYNLDPDADEGQLTRRRVALVRAETLVRWAREIDLGSYLYLGLGERPGLGSRDRMLAGAFEAVIGAVALDRGFGAARKFLLRLLERDAPEIVARAEGAANPKGRLQELLQERYRRAPEYQTVSTQGPDHARTFVVEASFDETVLGRGVGPSKREAEQAAAAAALATLAADLEVLPSPSASAVD
jgi:ribonuclease-3